MSVKKLRGKDHHRLARVDYRAGASWVAVVVKSPPANAGDVGDVGLIPGWEDPLEEETAAHSSVLAWRIPWTEEPGGLQSTGSQRFRRDWSKLAHTQARRLC